MRGGIKHRSNSPIIIWLQSILRGAEMKQGSLRFADCIAARTQPQPDLPEGPYHKTSKIYYFARDARREVKPPVAVPVIKQISAEDKVSAKPKVLTPGKLYFWD